MTHSLVIASDHAGYELKEQLKSFLAEQGYACRDLGAHSLESVDYPAFGYAAAREIASGSAQRAIVICGSGIGISMAANREPKVRCALCHDGLSAELSRRHNDANMLALGARLIGIETAKECVQRFLTTEYEGGRHQRRVDLLTSPTL